MGSGGAEHPPASPPCNPLALVDQQPALGSRLWPFGSAIRIPKPPAFGSEPDDFQTRAVAAPDVAPGRTAHPGATSGAACGVRSKSGPNQNAKSIRLSMASRKDGA